MPPKRSRSRPASPPTSPPSFFHGWICLWLIGITSLLYGWTLDFPMVFDDISYLQQNPLFLDSQSFSFPFHYQEFLQKPGKLGFDPELAMNFVLRPVAYATLHLNYLFDGFSPSWYRLFNVTIHALNACLIYAVLQMLFIVAKSSMNITSKRRVSVIAATLFAVHPLAIESVTYIVQRFTSLGAFFYLLTLLLQICAWSEAHEARRQKWRWAALGTLLLGLFTKECTITAPIMLVLIDVMICRTHWRDALRRNRLLLACLPIIPLHVMLISFVQNAGALDLDHAMNMTNMQAAPYLYWDFALTQTTVLMHYFRLILWPTGLVLDPEWPLYHSVFAGPVLSSTLLILAMVGLALWMIKPAQTSLSRHLGGLCLLWFFITIIPSSGLVPLPDLVAEHRSYLPSVGIFIACALLLDIAVSKVALLARFQLGVNPVAAVMVVMLCLTTWQRNSVWSSEISLWQDVTEKSPDRARAWNNLGAAHIKRGQFKEAIPAYLRAIELLATYEIPYLNLMICYNQMHSFSSTLLIREKLSQAAPAAVENVQVLYQEALARFGLKQLEQAEDVLDEVVQKSPDHRPALVLLGSTHQQMRRHVSALRYFERAAELEAPNESLKELISLSRRNFE